jgi:putative SOS response-associated peptidase YedK
MDLIPNWAKDPKIGYKTINARAETVDTAPSYREGFRKRRCLIPADGFYEWHTIGGAKIPFAIGMKDDRPFGSSAKSRCKSSLLARVANVPGGFSYQPGSS